MTKLRTDESLTPSPRPLTFRGLDRCDLCGGRLEQRDRLCGLCPACQIPTDGGDDREP